RRGGRAAHHVRGPHECDEERRRERRPPDACPRPHDVLLPHRYAILKYLCPASPCGKPAGLPIAGLRGFEASSQPQAAMTAGGDLLRAGRAVGVVGALTLAAACGGDPQGPPREDLLRPRDSCSELHRALYKYAGREEEVCGAKDGELRDMVAIGD